MNAREKVEELRKKAKEKYLQDCQDINEIEKAYQKECKHEFRVVEGLLYHLGETYPGRYCDKCGAMWHLKD